MTESARYWLAVQNRRATVQSPEFIRWRNAVRFNAGTSISRWKWDHDLLRRLKVR